MLKFLQTTFPWFCVLIQSLEKCNEEKLRGNQTCSNIKLNCAFEQSAAQQKTCSTQQTNNKYLTLLFIQMNNRSLVVHLGKFC